MKQFFLLMASAWLLSACCCQQKTFDVTVVNPSDLDRKGESIELCLDDVKEFLGLEEDATVVVFNSQGEEIPSQILYNSCRCLRLLFQADVAANDSAVYRIKAGTPQTYETKAQATFMPRRKDDISWENDCSIFRMYGPALATDKDEALISGGLDIWVKRMPKLVSQQWYQDEFDGKSSYHHDNGEGLDFYSVGKTLGAGGVAPFVDGKLWYVGNNFVKHTILENGPIRTMFQLDYDAYDVNGQAVSESRIITLDAGSYLNKVVVRYEGLDKPSTVAAGFPFRGFPDKKKNDQRGLADCQDIVFDKAAGYIAYAEPEHAENGIIYLGSLMTLPVSDMLLSNGHVLNCCQLEEVPAMMYYSGGAWNKGGFNTLADWAQYMADYAARIKQPLVVKTSCASEQHCRLK